MVAEMPLSRSVRSLKKEQSDLLIQGMGMLQLPYFESVAPTHMYVTLAYDLCEM